MRHALLALPAMMLAATVAHASCFTQGGDYAPCSWPDSGFRIPETGEKIVEWPSPQARAVYQAFRTLENAPGGPGQVHDIAQAPQDGAGVRTTEFVPFQGGSIVLPLQRYDEVPLPLDGASPILPPGADLSR